MNHTLISCRPTERLELGVVWFRRRGGKNILERVGIEELKHNEIALSKGKSLESKKGVGRNSNREKREQEDELVQAETRVIPSKSI